MTTEVKKRKAIDLPESVFRYLSIKAVANGQNLKNYIENLLVKEVEDMDDSATYAYLSQIKPEGKIMLDEQENENFKKWLGIGSK